MNIKKIKEKFGGLEPFDNVGKKKEKLEKLRMIFFLAGMLAVFVYFIIEDVRNPVTSLTQEDPGKYVNGDSETHFTLPDTYFCMQTRDYAYTATSGFRVTFSLDSWDLTKYDSQGDTLTSSDESSGDDYFDDNNSFNNLQQERSTKSTQRARASPNSHLKKGHKVSRDEYDSSSSYYSSDAPPLTPGPKMVFGDQPNVDFFTSYSDYYQCIHIVSDGNYFVSNIGEYWEFDLYWTISWDTSKTEGTTVDFSYTPFYVYVNYDSTETVDTIAAAALQSMKLAKSATVEGDNVSPAYNADYLLQFFTPVESSDCGDNEGSDKSCATAYFSIDYGLSQFTVETLTKEDGLNLAKRIITDTGSLTGIIGVLAVMIFSEFIARLILPTDDKTNFIPQETREAILHLVNEHHVTPKDSEMKSVHDSKLASIEVKG